MRVDLTGRTFGYIAVRKLASRNPVRWECRCVCGKVVVLPSSYLVSGDTKSCGCMRPKMCREANLTHGMSRTPTYNAWCRLIARCCNVRSADYPQYGGRGISVCDRWRHSFQAFRDDMGDRPEGHLIDRIDFDGDYEPGNCRWATPKVSSRNRRGRLLITAFGETKCATEWADDPRCKAGYCALAQRVRELGWDHERAIVMPSQRMKV